MKVHVVIKYIGYEDTTVMGVFSTREKAEAFTEKYPVHKGGHEIYEIEDWEVE